MIITRLIGGLGNQLFQYAAARRLAYHLEVPLKLDISGFTTYYTLRTYNLHHFNIIEEFASPQDLRLVKKSYISGLKHPKKLLKETMSELKDPEYRKNLFHPEKSITLIKEKSHAFNPEIITLPDNVYLDGYWQNENYFKDIEEIIRNEFKLKVPPSPLNEKIGQKITETESVSIHVRRGDYVRNPLARLTHGLCSLDYYQKAIDEIVCKIDRPHFYVFSDDPEWTKDNIKFTYPADYISHNDASKGYEDLRLMRLCKHHIIANSSFSWWGAWLGSNGNSVVIGPSPWFNILGHNDSDIMPESWIRIKAN